MRTPAPRRSLAVAATLGLLAAFLAHGAPATAAGHDEGLRYATSYADAVAQAKERGALVFATFHKDN